MFKVNNKHTRKDFEEIVLLSLLLTLNIFHIATNLVIVGELRKTHALTLS